MADTKISALTAATVVSDADVYPAVRAGANVKVPHSVLADYISQKIGSVPLRSFGYIPSIDVGSYFDQSIASTDTFALLMAGGYWFVYPLLTPQQVTIDRIGYITGGATPGGELKLAIYSGVAANGYRPDVLEWSSSVLNSSAAGALIEATLSLTKSVNKQYYVAFKFNSNHLYQGLNTYAAPNMGKVSATGNTYVTCYYRTSTFADPAPSPWGYSAAEKFNYGVPSTMMRKA